jgi:hypothetical protein
MGNLDGYNANDHEPTDFELVPKGDYEAIIVDSKKKATKTGGEMLVLEFVIIEGPYKNRKLWERLNLVNSSTVAVEIAQGTLSSICRAVGVMTPQDSSELHSKPLTIKVGIRPAQGGYDEQNEIKGYKVRPVAAEAKTMQSNTATPAADTPASGDIPF